MEQIKYPTHWSCKHCANYRQGPSRSYCLYWAGKGFNCYLSPESTWHRCYMGFKLRSFDKKKE